MKKLTLLLMISSNLFAAEEQMTFSDIKTSGTGCKSGTVSVSVSPDQQKVTFLFDEFLAEVPQYSGDNDNSSSKQFDENLDRKICNMQLKINLPKDKQLTSMTVNLDYRGFVFLEDGVSARFKSFLSSAQGLGIKTSSSGGVILHERWRARKGEVDEDYILSAQKKITLNSGCAKAHDRDIRLTLKNYIEAIIGRKAQGTGATGMIIMDSADMLGKMELSFSTRSCR